MDMLHPTMSDKLDEARLLLVCSATLAAEYHARYGWTPSQPWQGQLVGGCEMLALMTGDSALAIEADAWENAVGSLELRARLFADDSEEHYTAAARYAAGKAEAATRRDAG